MNINEERQTDKRRPSGVPFHLTMREKSVPRAAWGHVLPRKDLPFSCDYLRESVSCKQKDRCPDSSLSLRSGLELLTVLDDTPAWALNTTHGQCLVNKWIRFQVISKEPTKKLFFRDLETPGVHIWGRVSPLVHGLNPRARKEGRPGPGSLWRTDAAGCPHGVPVLPARC